MKKLILYICILAACNILSSCDNDKQHDNAVHLPSNVEIIPRASLSATRTNLLGAVDGATFPKNQEGIFAVSAFLDKTCNKPYFNIQPVDCDSVGNLNFRSSNGFRYYPEDGAPLFFYAVSPVPEWQNDPKKAVWNLTGQEDIMYAVDTNNSLGFSKISGDHFNEQQQPMFTFRHLLTRFNVRERWGNGFPDKMIISEIKILNCIAKAAVDLESGNIINEYEAGTKDFICNVTHEISALVHFADVCSIMCMMGDNMKSIQIEVVVSDIRYGPVEILAPRGGTFEAGVSYNIDLEFESNRMIPYVRAAAWKDGGSSTEDNYIL